MAAAAGPKINKERLILALDVNNQIKSWKGAPTTNLKPDLDLNGMSGIGLSYQGIDNGWKKYALSGTWSRGSYPYSMRVENYSFSGGVTYSTSCYLKINCAFKLDYIFTGMNYVNEPKDKGGNSFSIPQQDGSFYVGRENFQYTSNATQPGYLLSRPKSDGTTFDPSTDFAYIKEGQIEEGVYATPYVDGTRGIDDSFLDTTGNTLARVRNLSFTDTGLFEFDGTDDYIDIYPDLTRPNQLTCQGWIYPENQYARFATPQINGIDNWIGYDANNQRLQFHYCESADTNNRNHYSTSGDIPYQTWTNFAIAIDDRDWYIWINGELKNSGTESFQIGSWDSRWEIGQRGNGSSYFRGKLYYLSIYDRLLTDNEVLDNYSATRSRFANL